MLESNSENYALHDLCKGLETGGLAVANVLDSEAVLLMTPEMHYICTSSSTLSILCASIPDGLKFCAFYSDPPSNVCVRRNDHSVLGSTASRKILIARIWLLERGR